MTLTLYPLTVLKTKQMTLPGISGGLQVRDLRDPTPDPNDTPVRHLRVSAAVLKCNMILPSVAGCPIQGVRQTASTIMRMEGVLGFYRGFGTVMFVTIPARSVSAPDTQAGFGRYA